MVELLPPPVVISLTICDGIHTDTFSARNTLLGLFDGFSADEFPATLPRCCVYAEITECSEDLSVRVRFASSDPADEPILETEPLFAAADSPLRPHSVQWTITELEFPRPGVYAVQSVDQHDRVFGERRLFAEGPELETDKEPDDEP